MTAKSAAREIVTLAREPSSRSNASGRKNRTAFGMTANQFLEKVENCSAAESHSRSAMEKFPTSQAFGGNSGFLTSFGMTPKCIFPQPVQRPRRTKFRRNADSAIINDVKK
jgi:hypothetical protein